MRAARRWILGGPLVAAMLLAAPLGSQEPGRAPGRQRALLEGELRREFARAVRERVGLSDEQMQRLGPITRRHEQQRRELQMEERRARVALQTQLRSAAPDTVEVARLLDALLGVQRRRVQMIETEHRDLASVMTAVQRARYLALQEQVRRRMEQMRQGRAPR